MRFLTITFLVAASVPAMAEAPQRVVAPPPHAIIARTLGQPATDRLCRHYPNNCTKDANGVLHFGVSN